MDHSEFMDWLMIETSNVYKLSSRIEERVKIIVEWQEVLDKRVSAVVGVANDLTTRVVTLEARPRQEVERMHADNVERVEELERRVERLVEDQQRMEDRATAIVKHGMEVALAIVTAWLLFRLGWSH